MSHPSPNRAAGQAPAALLPARPLALAVHLIVFGSAFALGGWTPEALAQNAPASASRAYDIPAGPLGKVLTRFSSEAGLYLVGAGNAAEGKTSPGLKGRYSVAAGLAALLAGTGLEAFRQADGSYGLRPAPANKGEATLRPVTVTDKADLGRLTEGTGSYTTGSTNAATGMNLSLRETPQSVTVVTRQRMDEQQLNTVTDVLRQTTGIYITGTGPAIGGLAYVYSRGYQLDNYQLDGVPTSPRSFSSSARAGMAVDTAIYDSVSVVRGPTGLMTGAGNPSATVNLVRKRPTHAFQASVEAGLGRWDQQRVVADAGGPLNAAGSLRGRVVAAHEQNGSWYERYGKAERQVMYGVLEADLSDRTALTLALEHGREERRAFEGQSLIAVYSDGTPTPFSRHNSDIPAWGDWSEKRTKASIGLEHHFNDDWRARLSYDRVRHDTPTSKRAFIYDIDPDNTAGYGHLGLWGSESNADTLDARLNGRYTLLGKKHDLVAGFNSWTFEFSNDPGRSDFYIPDSVTVPVVDGVPQYVEPDWRLATSSNYTEHRTKQSGFYLATQLHPTDALSIIVGSRWTNWNYKFWSMPSGRVSFNRKYSGEFTPYAGVTYRLSDALSAYGSYTEIFNPQTVQDVNGHLLDPEIGDNKELGLKGEWFGGRLNASLALYESRKDNLAVHVPGVTTPTGGAAYRGEDHVKTRGWEVEMAGEPVHGWNLQAGYSRTVHRNSDGERVTPDTPIHQFKLFSTYVLPSLPRLTLGGGLYWQSEIHSTAFDHLGARRHATQKAYAVVDLLARYAFDDKLSLNLNLHNVFDETYRTTPEMHSYGAARNLYATLKYQF